MDYKEFDKKEFDKKEFDNTDKKLHISDVINFNYCKDCINDYDDPQMCKFCKNGSHQTFAQ